MSTIEKFPRPSYQTPRHKPRPRKRWLWRFGPAFWTITGVLSLVINLVLISVIILLAGQVFILKSLVSNQLLNGLNDNFALMDQARIQANIPVSAEVPAKFDLPLETDTRRGIDRRYSDPGCARFFVYRRIEYLKRSHRHHFTCRFTTAGPSKPGGTG